MNEKDKLFNEELHRFKLCDGLYFDHNGKDSARFIVLPENPSEIICKEAFYCNRRAVLRIFRESYGFLHRSDNCEEESTVSVNFYAKGDGFSLKATPCVMNSKKEGYTGMRLILTLFDMEEKSIFSGFVRTDFISIVPIISEPGSANEQHK